VIERRLDANLSLDGASAVPLTTGKRILYMKCTVAGKTMVHSFVDGEAVWLNANCAITIPTASMEMPGAVIMPEGTMVSTRKSVETGLFGAEVGAGKPLVLVQELAQFTSPALTTSLCRLVSSLRVCYAREMVGTWLAGLPANLPDQVLEILLDNLRMATHGRFQAGVRGFNCKGVGR
jgi:hypothetical protein